jgi:hypothetical protein
VHLRDHAEVGVAADDADKGAGLDPERPPDIDQDLVAGRFDDDLVEADVVEQLSVEVLGFGCLPHSGELVSERGQLLL